MKKAIQKRNNTKMLDVPPPKSRLHKPNRKGPSRIETSESKSSGEVTLYQVIFGKVMSTVGEIAHVNMTSRKKRLPSIPSS